MAGSVLKRLIPVVVLIVVLGVLASLQLEEPGSEPTATVSVYSAHSQAIIDALAPRFQQETGIELAVVKMGSGEVIQRVLAERANPQCDVIWSIAGDQLQAQQELLEPYAPDGFKDVDPVYKGTVKGNWLPYTVLVPVFVVNTQKLQGETPQRWTDLAAARFKDQISSARADRSGSSFMQLVTVLRIHGDPGWDVYKGLLANTVLSASSSAVPRFVNDGEATVGITLEDNAQRYVAGGGPVEIVYPADGTCVAPDGVALVKGAPHPDEAKRFIDWLLTKPIQEFLVQEMGRRSVLKGAAAPKGLPPLTQIKTAPYDFAWSAANKKPVVARWKKLVAELGK